VVPTSDNPLDKMVFNLHNLSKHIKHMETEHEEGTNVIATMSHMLNAML
jgi:hypothetical protein